MRATDLRSDAAPDVIAALRATPLQDAGVLYRAAALAVRAGRDEEALPFVAAAAAKHPNDARLAQMQGLAARNIGDLTTALAAFGRAHLLLPTDPLIAHSLARSRLEAGLPAVDAFARALRLAPNDGSVIQGLAAARLAAGDAAGADAEIDQVLRREPLWLDGHATLSRLRRMAGDVDDLRSYRDALVLRPRDPALWMAWLATLVLAERYDAIPGVVRSARGAVGDNASLDLYAAIAADEAGQYAQAAERFQRLPAPDHPAAIVWHVRHLLRNGRITEAAILAERGVTLPEGRILWPYVAVAWRLLGDRRWEWLEGRESFVRIFDLPAEAIDLPALAARLRMLHVAKDRPLDQSVRGGTQTDGPLFSRIDPEIVALRRVIGRAVKDYVAGFPAHDTTHPLLAAPREHTRFAGSWSVRLTDGGHHADHVHTHGWISSAFYVALPEAIGDTSQDGWLALGAVRTLLPDLAPFRIIEPKPGRLVLFPSTMWHGTLPFASGDRLTVAFDVAARGGTPA